MLTRYSPVDQSFAGGDAVDLGVVGPAAGAVGAHYGSLAVGDGYDANHGFLLWAG